MSAAARTSLRRRWLRFAKLDPLHAARLLGFGLASAAVLCGCGSTQQPSGNASPTAPPRIFDGLQAPLWSAQVNAHLGRIGLRLAARHELSPTESAVARLAAQGSTNRAIASKLFLSPKSVDSVILRVYDKLGIRSRAELGSWMTAHKDH